MADLLLPPWLDQARVRIRYLDNTGASRSPYNGAPRTATFGGDRLAASLEMTPQGGASKQMERAALMAFLARMRGRQNRVYLSDASARLRGSFPASELLSNNTFASGVTGWTASSSELTRTVDDRVMRVMRTGLNANASISQLVSGLTQYAPYVARAMVSNVLPSYRGAIYLGSGTGSSDYGGTGTLTDVGLHTLAAVVPATSAFFILRDFAGTGRGTSPVWTDFSYVSLSRCALVDNGPNALLQSDEFDATWTTTNASVDDQAAGTVAPDGGGTADSIIEDSAAAAAHGVNQSVTIAATAGIDYAFTVALKAGTRTWARLVLQRNTNSSQVWFNLATGAVGTVSNGTNWSDTRAAISPLGNGWYLCSIVGRSADTTTSLSAHVRLATGDNISSYTGDGTSNIYAWRGTLAQSSVPTRLVSTTTTATSGTSQTGSALYVKGLPASTNGLLLPGDQFEVITSRGSELKIVTAPLNSSAAGLGYLQFEPPLRGTPADNAPIIINQPMGRFMFSGEFPEWLTEPGLISAASADFEEA